MQLINRYKKYILIIGITIILLTIFIMIFFKHYNQNNIVDINDDNITYNTTSKVIVTEDKQYVDIKGAVKKPGVYEFNNGEKIIDAIEKAGGLTKNAVTSNINLSKKLQNEMVIYIFSKNELTTTKKVVNEISSEKDNNLVSNESEMITNYLPTNDCHCETIDINNCIDSVDDLDEKNKDVKININTANVNELISLSGIGTSKAEAIISYREKNGSFKSIEEIKNVSGLGDALFDKIKDNIKI